jgi:hypothetical protein
MEASQVSATLDFDNTELSFEFLRLGLQEPHLPVVNSGKMTIEPPPSKRRRVNEETSVIGEIISDLYDLLGSQRTTNIDGLHQFAV